MRVARLTPALGAVVVGLVLVCARPALGQQSPPPMVTSVEAVLRDPAFFDGRPLTLAGTPASVGGQWTLAGIALVPDSGQLEAKPLELSGILALNAARLELRRVTWTDDVSRPASIRDVVLHPSRWLGRSVTLRGQFRGRNLARELPDRANPSPADFVLQSGPAAVWIAGLQPRGRYFDLDPNSTRDVGRWLDVTGIVRIQNGEVRVDGTAIASAPAPPPTPAVSGGASLTASVSPYRLPRPKVVFTAPVNREVDVEPDATVRVQFSRDMREASLADQIQVVYANGNGATPPPFTITYRVRTRSVTLKFGAPLSAGATVIVRLGPNMAAMDGSFADAVEFSFRVAGGQ